MTSDADDIAKVKEHVSSINYLRPFKLSLQAWKKLKGGDSFKSCRSNIEGQFINSNNEMLPHLFTMRSSKSC
jgi:hypothetical protein